MVRVMKNAAESGSPTISPVDVAADSTSSTYSPSRNPGFAGSPTSLASLTANDPPPVGGFPTIVADAFDDTEPAVFGVGVAAPGAGVLTIVTLDLPAPFTCAPAVPASATHAATAIPRIILPIRRPPLFEQSR